MATIKVFSPAGVRELKCFDTLDNVPFMDTDTGIEVDEFELSDLQAED